MAAVPDPVDEPEPELARLRDGVIAALDSSQTAAQVFDEDNRLVYASPQLLVISGLGGADDLALGEKISPTAIEHSAWTDVVPDDDTLCRLAEQLDSASSPLWVLPLRLRLDGRERPLGVLGLQLRAPDGRRAGTALVYAPLLPAQVLAMVAAGDPDTFKRMAALAEPARRSAAVVFVDIDSSATLSRRLPTRAYFELIRAMTTAVDDMVAARCGIVGKHAGDGASAFFLADDLGGDSAAARAALELVMALPRAVADAVSTLAAQGMAVDPDRCRINIGAHWGGNLYMGQVVTGGRLEVTALGDEVNETARIEQVATGGEVLASKTLLERLDSSDAAALDLDPDTRPYELVGDRVEPSTKAWRDAGALAVTRLDPRPHLADRA